MKRKILIFLTFTLMLLLFAFSSSAAEKSSISADNGIVSVNSVYGKSKKDALAEAASQVESGTSPSHITYFADGMKNRTVDDGYYTITLEDTAFCFNVDSDGANSDYEGIRITVWENTDDITQRFRLVMNEDGTYSVYAACSKGGYNRAVGYNEVNGTVGLYSPGSPYKATFYIRNTSESGAKMLVLSTDETLCLAGDPMALFSGSSVLLVPVTDEAYIKEWHFETWGSAAEAVGELAEYPASDLLVTQMAYDIYSHMEQNATDIQTTGTSIFAPFTCKVVAINEPSGNVVWVQSVSKVYYADGSYDYMTCLFMHDDDISDIYEGQIILKGQEFYDMGVAGYAEGAHVHISCFRGEYTPAMNLYNTDEKYAVNIENAFYIPKDINVIDDYGLPFVWETE